MTIKNPIGMGHSIFEKEDFDAWLQCVRAREEDIDKSILEGEPPQAQLDVILDNWQRSIQQDFLACFDVEITAIKIVKRFGGKPHIRPTIIYLQRPFWEEQECTK